MCSFCNLYYKCNLENLKKDHGGGIIKEDRIKRYRSKYTRKTIEVGYAGLLPPEQHV